MFTYRAEGHSTSDDPTAVSLGGRTRPPGRSGDPVVRLKNHLIAIGEWDEERHAAQDKANSPNMVKAAQKEAEKNGILGHGLHQPLDTPVRRRVRRNAVASARAAGADDRRGTPQAAGHGTRK